MPVSLATTAQSPMEHLDRISPRQKPHDLAVGPLNNILRGAKPRFKRVDAKMNCLRHDPPPES
jgi:hypothetical protein